MAVRRARALSIFALVLVGCSGAAGTEFFDPASEENDTAATQPTPSAATTAPAAPAAPDATGTPPPVPTAEDAGPQPPPGPPKCTPEAEPNNDITNATTFTTSLCGKIESNGDVDFGRFVVPAGATEVAITHTENGGKVSYRYYLNGKPMPGDEIIAIPGAVYSVQMKLGSGGGGDRPTYELAVAFK